MEQIGDDAHLAGASSTPSGPVPQVQGAAAAAVHSCRTELLLQYDRMSTNLENDPPKPVSRMDSTEIGSICTSQPNPSNISAVTISETEIAPPSSQPSVAIVSPIDAYLHNPFPMFEHVGVNEEVLYGEEVHDLDEEGENLDEEDEMENEEETDGSCEEAEDVDGNEEEDWVAKDVEQSDIPKVVYDKEDPPMMWMAYEGMIPAMTDKKQLPKPDKDFFLYPPLLRRPAGRPRIHRFKSANEGGSKKKRRGSAHECPICHQHGHHWNTCREGDPEAKEALALLAAQKKADNKRKKQEMANTEAETSDMSKRQRIAPVPNQIEAPAGPTTKKKGKEKGTEKETRKIQKNGKAKGTAQATPTKAATDSLAMGTRSRKRAEESPAMGTRNKRRREDNQVMGTNTKRRLNDFL